MPVFWLLAVAVVAVAIVVFLAAAVYVSGGQAEEERTRLGRDDL